MLHALDKTRFTYLVRERPRVMLNNLQLSCEQLGASLSQTQHATLEQAIENLQFLLNEPTTLQDRFLHGDFHLLNILSDRAQITAVLDWNNAWIGDPHWDFRYMQEMGDDMAEQTLQRYQQLTDLTLDRNRLQKIWHIQGVVLQLNRLAKHTQH